MYCRLSCAWLLQQNMWLEFDQCAISHIPSICSSTKKLLPFSHILCNLSSISLFLHERWWFFQVAKKCAENYRIWQIQPGCEFLDKNTKRTWKRLREVWYLAKVLEATLGKLLGYILLEIVLGVILAISFPKCYVVGSTTSPSSTEDSTPQLDWMYSPKVYSLVPDR